jgi:tetratricopeptide (TPR) repeat protein
MLARPNAMLAPSDRIIAGVLVAMLLSVPFAVPVVHADAPHVAPEQRLPPTPEWRTLYDAGSAAFDAGRLDEALSDFTRAHERGGPAALLYDIALTLDRLNRTADAIAAYHRYIDAVPEASNRELVEARLGQLEPPAGTATHVTPSTGPILSLVAPDPVVTTTETTPTVYTSHDTAPVGDHWEQQGPEWTASWVMLGLTALTTAAAIIVWYDGQARFDELWNLCASDRGCSATEIAESPAHVNEDATNALMGVSIGLGALTILTFVVEGVVTGNRLRMVRADRSEGPRLSIGLGSFSLSGTF